MTPTHDTATTRATLARTLHLAHDPPALDHAVATLDHAIRAGRCIVHLVYFGSPPLYYRAEVAEQHNGTRAVTHLSRENRP